ncbi:MAG: NAD(P)H-hydrate dehydratase [Sulfitobacter sp.]
MNTPNAQTTVFEMTDAHWQALQKTGDAHKHCYGHAAVVSGPAGQGGAARLAARGALRIGAGVVSVICALDAVSEHAAQLNAIMVKPYSQGTGFLDRLTGLKPQAICIGPNMGLELASQTLLSQTLSLGLPTCIDADAITLLADATKKLPAILNPQSVLTPHEGELRRFIPEVFATTSCRVSLAQNAATKAGCVVLFKGPDTVIAAPGQPARIVSSKPFQNTSWLATAGSGDVLAGFITGLLARGFDGFEAASLAADLHFRCADTFGPGLIAEDIPEMLPRVFR